LENRKNVKNIFENVFFASMLCSRLPVCGRAAAAAAVMRWDGRRLRHCRVEVLLPLRVTLIMDLHQH